MKEKVLKKEKSIKPDKKTFRAKIFNRSLEKKKAFAGYFFVLPLILGLLVIFIPNMIQTFIFSLNDIIIESGRYSLERVGFTHFSNALTIDPQFIRLLVESLRQIATDIPVILIFSLFIASILNQNFRGRLLARSIFFVPVILATGIIAKVESLTNIMHIVEVGRQTGQSVAGDGFSGFENLLRSLNFNASLIDVVVAAANGIYRVVQSSGIQIFIFMAALQEVPVALYEAADVEGSSKWESFWKITLPVISPQILVCSVYTIVDTFTSPTSPMFEYVNRLAFLQNQYGLATAMYMIYFLAVSAIIIVSGVVISKFVFYND